MKMYETPRDVQHLSFACVFCTVGFHGENEVKWNSLMIPVYNYLLSHCATFPKPFDTFFHLSLKTPKLLLEYI